MHRLPATLLALVLAGCAAPSRIQPRPGSGIAEYRQLTREAHQAVAATIDALEALSRPNPKNAPPHPALAGFDRALHDLELSSVKTRARAEAIITRGQAYFEEWKEQLAGVTNAALARVESGHYERMLQHFERVREQSGQVRTEFRPFMAQLREFRAALDKSPRTDAGTADVLAGGRRVLQALQSVAKALDDAEVELRATLAAKR